MPRNVERDAREEERRRRQIIAAGFNLFSEKGIENVSLQSVADAADVGIATLYNYYQNKISLCIAISGSMWNDVMKKVIEEKHIESDDKRSAYEMIEAYCDLILYLYRERPDVLRYSGNYKTFICRENVTEEQLEEHLTVLKPVNDIFHNAYEKAKTDKSIRTDIPESELFTTIALTVLGMGERYALGLVWAMKEDRDYTREIMHMKEMVMDWVKG